MRIWSRASAAGGGGGGCFERHVALRSYKNLSPPAAQYIQSMQQAAVAVGAPRFVVDMRPDPWDVFTANAWTLMPAAVCMWIEKVLVAMLQRDYAGPDAVAIPVPVMPVQAIVELPLPFYVAISRRGTHSIWINQFRVTLIGEDIRSRPIRTPPSITDRFPFTVFDHVRMSDRSLRALFWGRLAKVWALVGAEISLRPQPKMAPVEIKGDITEQRLFHHARVVLQAEIMQPQAKHTAVLIPADGSGDLFAAFVRVGALTVNVCGSIDSISLVTLGAAPSLSLRFPLPRASRLCSPVRASRGPRALPSHPAPRPRVLQEADPGRLRRAPSAHAGQGLSSPGDFLWVWSWRRRHGQHGPHHRLRHGGP